MNPKRIRDEQRHEWQKEWPFTVELLPLDWLFADDRYQRDPILPFIAQSVRRFDPTLVGTIDVSMRAPDSYAILDGLQRSEIVKQVDKRAVWCSVYRGMGLNDEAEFFVAKNRERRNMHPFYALRARKVAGNQAAKEIFRISGDTGFKLAATNTKRSGEVIVAVGALEEVHARTSLARPNGSLQPTLATLQEAFGGRDGATEGQILRGFGRFFQAFYEDEISHKNLIEQLQDIGPKKLSGFAADRAGNSKHPKAFWIATEVINFHNKGLPRHRKLSATLLHPGAQVREQAKRS
jgi:uncharacterized protein DUF6551